LNTNKRLPAGEIPPGGLARFGRYPSPATDGLPRSSHGST